MILWYFEVTLFLAQAPEEEKEKENPALFPVFKLILVIDKPVGNVVRLDNGESTQGQTS